MQTLQLFRDYWAENLKRTFLQWGAGDAVFSLVGYVIFLVIGSRFAPLPSALALAAIAWFVVLLTVITPMRMWVRLRPQPLDVEVSLSGLGANPWLPFDLRDLDEGDRPEWWALQLSTLRVTNRSSTRALNLSIEFVLGDGEELLLREEPYDMYRRQGEPFFGGDLLPNPLHLDPESTRKGEIVYPLFGEDVSLVKDADLAETGLLRLRDYVSGETKGFPIRHLPGFAQEQPTE